MIEVRGLYCAYGGRDVLHGVSLHLEEGRFTGLLGPNGGGKSTLLKVVSGVLAPRAGEIFLQGRSLRDYAPRERARLVACVPQRGEAPDGMRVRDLVLLGRYARLSFWQGHGRWDMEAVDTALEETDLTRLAGRRANQISGGELQRAFLARALAQQTPLLLLDEPAAGLDPAHALAACEILARRNAAGATVLMASHDLNLAALYCHSLIFLKEGRVAAQGSTREVFTREILESVYATPVAILEHPETGAPQAVLLPGGAGAAGGHDRPGRRPSTVHCR